MASSTPISIFIYNRLLSYLRYLQTLPSDVQYISSAAIGSVLEVNDVQIRRDLAMVSKGGKPKVGYAVADLLADLAHFLGHDNSTDAVLAGAGNLGRALLSYKLFKDYGLNILAAFDCDPAVIGTSYAGVQIVDAVKTADLCERLNANIGIITVPANYAQEVCDDFVAGGVQAVWNFAPVNLKVPETVVVRNEDMAASLAMIMKSITQVN